MLMFIGVLFGALAPEDHPWDSRALGVGAVVALVFTATAFISYIVAPDWMWMYFLPPSDVSWSLPVIALGYFMTFGLGFAAALGLRPLGPVYVRGTAVALLLAEVGVIAVTWDRYRAVGTKQEWLSGSAHPLFAAPPTGPVRLIGVLGPIFAIALIGGVMVTWRSRRASASDR